MKHVYLLFADWSNLLSVHATLESAMNGSPVKENQFWSCIGGHAWHVTYRNMYYHIRKEEVIG